MAMAVAGVSDPYCRSRPRLEAARRMPWPSSETAQARTPDIARTGTITRRRGTLPSWNGRGVGRNWGIPRYPLEVWGDGPVEDLCGNRPRTRWITPARLAVPEVLVLT